MIGYGEKFIREAIDTAWNNPEGKELREELFPEGKPEPDLFVQRLTRYAQINLINKLQ